MIVGSRHVSLDYHPVLLLTRREAEGGTLSDWRETEVRARCPRSRYADKDLEGPPAIAGGTDCERLRAAK